MLAVEAVGHAHYAALHGSAEDALVSIRKSASATSGDEVFQAMRADLVPWLLGYSDPVRERVEARRRSEAGGP
ncbi:MAG: hypothetical protein R3F62_28005 [Planctomycetota bacterium]